VTLRDVGLVLAGVAVASPRGLVTAARHPDLLGSSGHPHVGRAQLVAAAVLATVVALVATAASADFEFDAWPATPAAPVFSVSPIGVSRGRAKKGYQSDESEEESVHAGQRRALWRRIQR
jgi:hypothetical protein